MSKFCVLVLYFIAYLLTACSTFTSHPSTPRNTENLCEVFKQKNGWYNASNASYRKWGISVPVQMAIMHQESRFVADAEPSNGDFFSWLFNSSSAYGYPQAKDETWNDYQKKTGNSFAKRDNFADACDFIGWYSQMSYSKLGIAKNDAKNLYLAYHEGLGGFQKQTYNQKTWLLRVANNVANRAQFFQQQLNSCGLQ